MKIRIGQMEQKPLVIAAAMLGLLLIPASASVPAGIGSLLPNMPQVRVESGAARKAIVIASQKTNMTHWIPVPEWLAGTWQAKKQAILASYDYSTKKPLAGLPDEIAINRISRIGSQQDGFGGIWHMGAPSTRTIDTAHFTEYQKIERVQLVTNTPNLVTIKCIANVARVSKPDYQVIETFRQETNSIFTRIADGLMLTDFQITDYDQHGNALYCSRAMCTETRIKPFQVVDEDTRGDLKAKFHQFLFDTGRLYLIPLLR